MSNPISGFDRNPFISWQFLFIQILLLAIVAVMLGKPTGTVSGRIAIEEPEFKLYSYNLKQQRVYVTVVGPHASHLQEHNNESPSLETALSQSQPSQSGEEERGVWVDNDGRFEISRLPVGEYSLKIRAPGFSTYHEDGIFVEDGKITPVKSPISLSLSNLSAEVACNSRVFTSTEKPVFWAHAQGATSMSVKIYRKDLLSLLSVNKDQQGFELSGDLGIYKTGESDNRKIDVFKNLMPVKSWTRTLHSDLQDWAYESFKCDTTLPKGDYFVVAQTSNIRNEVNTSLLWFSVTDLGLVVKQDVKRTVVRALDLRTLKPLPGVSVRVLDREDGSASTSKDDVSAGRKNDAGANPANSAVTGANGFAEIKMGTLDAQDSSTSMIVYGSLGQEHAYGGTYINHSIGEHHKTYFYTERPIYRLGQTVCFRGICRDIEDNGFKNPGLINLKLKLEDPDNSTIWKGSVRTNKWGSFHGLLEIPAGGKTGVYQVCITYPDGSNAYERIEIDQYRKPEYQVDVTPVVARINAGSKGKARIKATYYFGAPVVNAKIKYSIFSQDDWSTRYRLKPRPDYYSYFDEWDTGDANFGSGGGFVSEGIAQTDASGEAEIEFETKPAGLQIEGVFENAYQDKKYKIEAEVTDMSRLSVMGTGFLSVTPGDFALAVEPRSYIAKVGEKIGANVQAIDYQGNPVANKAITAQLVRRLWDPSKARKDEFEYKGIQELELASGVTNKDGVAHVEFSTKARYLTDTYYIVASAKDAGAHMIRASESVWVVSENNPSALSAQEAGKEPVSVKLDKAIYKPGETVRAMISAPVTGKEGVEAIVAVEADEIFSYKAVPLTGSATLVELPVENSYAPNVYLTVTLVTKKKQFFNTSQLIKVAPQSCFLTINIDPDKKKYHPGDMANFTLKAVNSDGTPAGNVELAMGVVDESIYSIRSEIAPDIRRFFYSIRYNVVTTLCSFPEEYSGGPSKMLEMTHVRKDFRDTAAWFPSLVTNKDGVATARFKIPDNLTTWRATVRAVSLNAQVGWTFCKTVSTQDLIVRLALPRFFSQGDEGEISAVVHNYSDRMQNVNVNLAVSPEFKISKGLQQSVKLEPEKVSRLSWPVKAVTAGTGKVTVRATGQTAADAMEMKLPVRASGIPVVVSHSGWIAEDEKTVAWPVSYPADAAPGSVELSLHTASSSLSSVLGNFSSLIDYPYGCTEQTMSKLMPSVVAMKMNKKLGVPLEKADLDKFAIVYKQSMEKLNSYQHSDGGWGWWAEDESNLYLTSLVLEGYKLLEDAGYKPDPVRTKRGLAWLSPASERLRKQLADPSLLSTLWREGELMTDLAKSTYVQGLYGTKPSAGLVSWLGRKDVLIRLNPESLSYYAMAFKSAGLMEPAKIMFQRLLYLANTSSGGTLMNWERSPQLYKKLSDSERWNYYFNSYRFTGVESTALALRACLSVEPEKIDRIESIKSYILMERGKDGWGNTKTTAEVFRAFMEDELCRLQNAGTCSFKVDITRAGNSLKNLVFEKSSLSAPEQVTTIDLKPEQGEVILHKQGSGRLFWTCLIKYYKQAKPGQSFVVPSSPAGLKIHREFARLKAVYDSSKKVSFKEEPLTGDVKAGETLLMKIQLESPVAVPYTMLDVPLPSGAEVLKEDTREEIASRDKTDLIRAWWNHRDVMDDHMAFFMSNYHSGKSEIRAMLRMELPGKLQMNPVSLSGMYTDNVHGYSEAGQIQVVDKCL